MTSTMFASKSKSSGSDMPITEEELKKKETPITIHDVLRLRQSTNSKTKWSLDEELFVCCVDYLTETDENVYQIEFVHFRIRDMKTNKVLFEVERGSGMKIES